MENVCTCVDASYQCCPGTMSLGIARQLKLVACTVLQQWKVKNFIVVLKQGHKFSHCKHSDNCWVYCTPLISLEPFKETDNTDKAKHAGITYLYSYKKECVTLPLWWFCSRISITRAKSSGAILWRWSSSGRMCERLAIRRLRGEPGLVFDEMHKEYMVDESPEP